MAVSQASSTARRLPMACAAAAAAAVAAPAANQHAPRPRLVLMAPARPWQMLQSSSPICHRPMQPAHPHPSPKPSSRLHVQPPSGRDHVVTASFLARHPPR
ncbi:hypothetical protein COCCADRAFT_27571 [Bipolaris zeicola 26-R-13]|uniref:Uncharacterized protein n=1 Tax=Cochliobolus carbonum (strain 26-R-13) TaxID=930089 RepID=W6Y8T1_COCC2|nr:uncharacterized protein COCCADRAFT_27571 [Bipolaris zeicola 26-R-13]EUC31774.1 hypothetical protein COCCADRAFT_27571 [Bipolaris zeicola 26-R-13]